MSRGPGRIERAERDRRFKTPMANTLSRVMVDYPSAVVDRALRMMGSDSEWKSTDLTRWLKPNRVLAEPWNDFRLSRARRLLAAGENAPSIQVVGYRLGREPAIYVVGDGIHRTVAAREVGRRIKARIGGYYRLQPASFVLRHDYLCRPVSRDTLQVIKDVTAEERAVLMALGVRDMIERESRPPASVTPPADDHPADRDQTWPGTP